MIDILVLNYNDATTTTSFVNSVRDYSCVRKILVVDNHSKDNSLECLKTLENDKIVVVDSGENNGYGAGNNFGIRLLHNHYQSEYILLSNPDVIVEEKVLFELENFLRNNTDYALAAPFMLNAKGERVNYTAFRIPYKWEYIMSIDILLKKFFLSFDCGFKSLKSQKNVVDVGALAGSLFMMNASKMIRFGMFDEKIFLYCEEIVLGRKMEQAGQKIALLPKLSFIHNHSVSISKTLRSEFVKHKILLKSKKYVLKKYFHINVLEIFFVYLFSITSFVELKLLSFLRRK